MLTSQPDPRIAEFLTVLIQPYGLVDLKDKWMPRGFLEREEAKLGETFGFLSTKQRESVTDWWLKVRRKANTPNWDIVSTCRIGGAEGLLLVEAKAHAGELNVRKDNCGSKNRANQGQIAGAIREANAALISIQRQSFPVGRSPRRSVTKSAIGSRGHGRSQAMGSQLS